MLNNAASTLVRHGFVAIAALVGASLDRTEARGAALQFLRCFRVVLAQPLRLAASETCRDVPDRRCHVCAHVVADRVSSHPRQAQPGSGVTRDQYRQELQRHLFATRRQRTWRVSSGSSVADHHSATASAFGMLASIASFCRSRHRHMTCSLLIAVQWL